MTTPRKLRAHPDLDQLRLQAKELLQAVSDRNAEALAEVHSHFRNADSANFALHDAQLVLARSYGFDSWPKLKAYVDRVTVERLADAVKSNDLSRVEQMLKARPELINMDTSESNERRAIHYAVLYRLPEMVRLLMQRGADARRGIYPHREATAAHTLAVDRGFDEIVIVIEEEEQRRRETLSGPKAPPDSDVFATAIREDDADTAIRMLDQNPALLEARTRTGWAPLHIASAGHNTQLVGLLLDRGADPNVSGPDGKTPLDLAAQAIWYSPREAREFGDVAEALRSKEASWTLRSAVASGAIDWLQQQHSKGALANPAHDGNGLLTTAVKHNQLETLRFLLDCGLDPDERSQVQNVDEVVPSWGAPLWHSAMHGRYEMAKLLLDRGADPNGQVYCSGSVMYSALHNGRTEIAELLEKHGGIADAATLGHLRLTDRARKMLEDYDRGIVAKGSFGGESLLDELLWAALRGGDPGIVQMCLERIDWPRDHPRWHQKLWSPLPYPDRSPEDHELFLECFKLVLARANPNATGGGDRPVLHDIAGLDEDVPPEQALPFAKALLDAGARLDIRESLLKSTPLGWACRWGRLELVELFLERGADPIEAEAEPWATPQAWARKMGHTIILEALEQARSKPFAES